MFPSSTNGINIMFYVLGIGDIILPAIFISLMLWFDFLREVTASKLSISSFEALKASLSFPKPYFMTALVAYAVGMLATVLTFRFTELAMPALLFINPCVLFAVIGTSIYRGESKQLLFFDEDWCIEECQGLTN
jgi:minor histocompatibility antigen H13